MFAASHAEFKHRFWVIAGLYWLSFSLYVIDHQNLSWVLAQKLAHLQHREPARGAVMLLIAAGAALSLLAAALRTWATGYLRPEVMVDGEVHSSRLVADGPYRWVRNPLYLGNMVMAVGFAMMASRVGALVLIVGHGVFLLRLIGREERELMAGQGESYAVYVKAVPRLLPALTPRVPAARHPFSLGAGLLGEAFFWGLALTETVFAATLKVSYFYMTLALAFVTYFACLLIIRRRGSEDTTA